MIDRRMILGLAVASCAMILGPAASGAEHSAYSEPGFAAALRAGKPILVEITAPWCPTCKAQKPILAELTAAPAFKDLQIFEIDFDSQKDAVRRFKARLQSTLIVFAKGQEAGRSVGDTDRTSIAALLGKAI